MTLIEQIARLVRPLQVRIANTITRGVVKTVDDSKKAQILQVDLLDSEPRDDVERLQNYGFTSHPEDGAEVVAACVGGRRDHAVVIAVDDRRYRIGNLEKGEVLVYSKTGSKVLLKANGDIEVTPSSGKTELISDLHVTGALTVDGTSALKGATTVGTVSANAPLHVKGAADATGNIDSNGTITGSTDVVGGGKSLKTHTHAGSPLTLVGGACTAGGVSGGPGQVGGNTGAPN